MTWVDGLITVDEGTTRVPGQYRSDQRWNGWLCVRMPFDSAVRVLEALVEVEAPVNGLRYRVVGDVVLEVHEWNTEGEPPTLYHPDDDGMYHLGSWAWCWELADDSCPFAEGEAYSAR